MAQTKFIKVTEKGAKEPRIVLATLKNFFIGQGAKVEIPTDEEVWAAEPSERPINVPAPAEKANTAELKRVKTLNAELEKTIDALQAKVKEHEATIETLNATIQANETTISESEQVIEGLRKELEAAQTAKAKPAKESK